MTTIFAGIVVGLALMSVGGVLLCRYARRHAAMQRAEEERIDPSWITSVEEAPASLSGIADRDAPVEIGFLRRRVPGATLAYYCDDPTCRARHCACRAPGTEAQRIRWEREERRRQMALLTPIREMRVFTSIVAANRWEGEIDWASALAHGSTRGCMPAVRGRGD